jgi:integrase
MAMARARHGSYIFQRPGSANWYVKLRSPGAKRVEKSLGTSDKLEAESRAGELITTHKTALLAARPRFDRVWRHELEPGRKHVAPDGGEILATDKELFYVSHSGAIIRTEPNGGPAFQLVFGDKLTVRSLAEATLAADFGDGPAERRTPPTKNGDDALFQTYLDHGGKKKTGVHGHYRREAESTWALFKRLTDNKPLKNCTRDDGRKLVTHFQAEGLKSATIQKKITWLNAACNLAISEGRLNSINPFSSIAPAADDESERLPLDDADMKKCKRNLDKLSASDQLLFRLLGTTGMRLSEAFQIDDEEPKEKGHRFVIIGKKTKQSKRRVPFPAGVLSYLPKAIKGPLFAGSAPAASKRLNRFLRDNGIADPNKVVHSLRHRAQDRLRAAGCSQDIREALLGHDEVTVGEGYGKGFPVTMLKEWIDRIGF